MRTPGSIFATVPVILLLAITGCADGGTTPVSAEPALPDVPESVVGAAASLDIAQGGTGGVYFLPPLQHSTYSGAFAADRSPEVVICTGAPTEPCATPVARFDTHRQPKQPNSEVIRVASTDEHYIVNWHPRRETRGVHRIFVVETGVALGYVDVIVVDHGTAVKDNRTGELRVIRGGLPIKFRMEGDVGPVNGLWAEYFDWRTTALDFGEAVPILQRVDPLIDFADFTGGVDVFNVGQTDQFMARWTGFVQAEFSEPYEFCILSDDGARLWIDGVAVVDDWSDSWARDLCGTIALTAGQKHSLKLEWYENVGAAVARLSWESPSRSKQIIPTGSLYTP